MISWEGTSPITRIFDKLETADDETLSNLVWWLQQLERMEQPCD